MIKRSICATKSIKKAALLALMMVGLTACTTQEQPKEQKNPLIFSTNFDNLQGWDKDNEKFQKENSKSGIWNIYQQILQALYFLNRADNLK